MQLAAGWSASNSYKEPGELMFLRGSKWTVGLLCLVGFSLGALAQVAAQQQTAPQLPADPNHFVAEVIQHELKLDDTDRSHWRYVYFHSDEKSSYERDVIETRDGELARELLKNGQPLTADQREQDEDRMRKLVNDPDERAKRNKRKKDDGDKAKQMLQAIPDAFIFKYDGFDGNLVRLTFFPNPHYDAPTRELRVFRSLSGKMWIDPRARHLARIDGTLFEDVTFGWGLLGRLNKGGTFNVVQKEVAPDHWEVVSLDVKMTGHAVIFKTLNVRELETFRDFQRMPDNLTIAQAYQLLEKDKEPVSANGRTAVSNSQARK
jgi:hypothetical protein